MKIATYNLQCGGKGGRRNHWGKLFEVANPDIFLVQETCEPEPYMSSEFWQTHPNSIA